MSHELLDTQWDQFEDLLIGRKSGDIPPKAVASLLFYLDCNVIGHNEKLYVKKLRKVLYIQAIL